MFNIQENLHRSPYEELQSINEDGSIIALKMSMDYNPIVGMDYHLGRFMNPDQIEHENDPQGLVEQMARRFPKDADIGLFASFGYTISKYLIDRPDASWKDVYTYLTHMIKSMSFWVAEDESEGYIIIIQSPLHSIEGDMVTLPSKDDERIFVYDKMGWRHPMMVKWTNDEVLDMNTAINENGYPYISYHIGAEWFDYASSTSINNKPYFVGGEYLSLFTMMKPVKLDILNYRDLNRHTHPSNLISVLEKLDANRDRLKEMEENEG